MWKRWAMQSKLSKYFYFTATFLFFVVATLYLSDMIVSQLVQGLSISNEVFSLNYVENSGAAFSIFKDAREFLIIASVVAICIVISYIIRNISSVSMKQLFFFAMLSAGIGGNLHERIAFGFVRDYIQLNFINFPVFNISDIMINIGVLAVVIIILRKKI